MGKDRVAYFYDSVPYTRPLQAYIPLASALRSARLPFNLIGSPINYANGLIGSPITLQSTATGLPCTALVSGAGVGCWCPPPDVLTFPTRAVRVSRIFSPQIRFDSVSRETSQ
jgi:hypothetical protein